jgi:hypothetical protein
MGELLPVIGVVERLDARDHTPVDQLLVAKVLPDRTWPWEGAPPCACLWGRDSLAALGYSLAPQNRSSPIHVRAPLEWSFPRP